jgi:hypothetical protein
MADMGSIQLRIMRTTGSRWIVAAVAGYFLSASALVIAVAVMTGWVVRESLHLCLLARKLVPSTNSPVTTADRIFSEFAFIFVDNVFVPVRRMFAAVIQI